MNTSPHAAEIAANVESIQRVPAEILPAGPREQLLELARSGKDVYCYKAAGPNGPWNVWLESQRVSVAEYVSGGAK